MTGGKAPVCVPEILHALATCPSGMRPVPVAASKPEMRGAPVVIVLHANGPMHGLAPSSWNLVPHIAAQPATDHSPALPEQLGRLVFHVNLPPGYRLIGPEIDSSATAEAEAVADLVPAVDPLDALPSESARKLPPEFAGLDPGIWEGINPDAINKGLRDVFRKGTNPDGNKGDPPGGEA